MNNNNFEEDKSKYDNIDIPQELDFIVRQSLKKGRNKRQSKRIYKWVIGVASAFLVFVFVINISPTIAYAMSKIPGLDRLIELVTFDKGFDNAVKQGLVKEIGYKNEEQGIKVKVNSIVGDWQRLWIGYEIEGDIAFDTDISVLSENGEVSWAMYNNENIKNEKNNKDSYIETIFNEYTPEFNIIFKIYDSNKYNPSNADIEYLATFNIPISLEELFNSQLEDKKINNNIITTEVGDIEIISVKAGKTRSTMEFNFSSEEYEYMLFENPRLVDNMGNKYEVSPFYINTSENDNYLIEFKGEIRENNVEFLYDSLYYSQKGNRSIVVNLSEETVENNDYNIEFVSYENGELVLVAKGVKNISFENNENLFSESTTSTMISEADEDSVSVRMKLKDMSKDEIELNISWILKDKIYSK